MKNRSVKVAVIDDGIFSEYPGIELCFDVEINSSLDVVNRIINNEKRLSHGTICSWIIKEYTSRAEIGSIKILDNNLRGNVQKLCSALRWCVDNGVKIANISLGSYVFSDYAILRRFINKIAQEGLIMICASQNGTFITYPASFSNVIGVKYDTSGTLSKGDIKYNPIALDGIEFSTFSRHVLIDDLGTELVLHDANSFAAPMISAKACDILYNDPTCSLDYIKKELIISSKNYYYKSNDCLFYSKPDWIISALIFSFKAQSYNIDRYYFDVENKYVLNHKDALLTIEHILASGSNSDTIIIIAEKRFDTDFWSKAINIAEIHNKNLVMLEDEETKIPFDKLYNSIKLWHSCIKNLEINNIHSEFKIDIPTILLCYPENFDINYFLCELKNIFNLHEYNAFISSDQSISVLYDLDYIPNICFYKHLKNVFNYLENIIHNKNIDICILSSVSKDYSKIKLNNIFNVDVIINLEAFTSEAVINIIETGEFRKVQLSNGNIEKAKELYDYIVSYYS
ncbi:S8 family serine peptidase [Clostridium saccharoperbutylacetonicum]|uniref:S8 family serine peptidase n=1 Tax=Clostridium saccharoperbutylacetonicum TaxID=36745 RepID=UPI0039ED90F7